ncbi:sigma-70 family RNA polymerase sigma factor [Bombilactobacillus bombi]|uniref:sigma-70 family RNA polymerase sigma factor n=1 Tax=Bombilactobacillus bombi TaxID=1303590 RepID=UPI0015E61B57|nr:sigma-70 family RNA polymerase sigma factor [Bombilactobacillus bombi]MBA1434277.1 sigma-70 family RNA polymerase sigma factor [Bombilactobacillus bombi]
MEQQHDYQTGFELAKANQRVIYGALKRAGVYRSNYLYEDLVQEAYLTYAQTWTQVDLTAAEFQHYVFQRIVWRTLDLLRHERFRQDHSELNELLLDPQADDLQLLEYQLSQLLPKLTTIECQILNHHLIQQQKLAPLAQQLGVTPRYLRKVRAQLKAKLQYLLSSR